MTRKRTKFKPAAPKKVSQSAVLLMVLSVQCLLGQTATMRAGTTSQATEMVALTPQFAVVSIRPTAMKDPGWKLEFTPDGCSARGIVMIRLMQEAFGILEGDKIVGLPTWAYSERWDIEAKVDEDDLAAFKKLDWDHQKLMLQAVLTDRFKLIVHRENHLQPSYILVVGKKGPRIRESSPEVVPPTSVKRSGSRVSLRRGRLTVERMTMTEFAKLLSVQVRRHVVDKTGLKSHYDLTLEWTPDNLAAPVPNSSNGTLNLSDSSVPSIFTAIKDQLGLRLKSGKEPVETLVIDQLERPTEN